jgi:hypothetical protein
LITRIPASHRIYFIDGPARGRAMLSADSPETLIWEDADGARHPYRREAQFTDAHLYRYVR